MLNALRLYGHYVSIPFRSQMEYRLSFVLQSIGQFLVNGIEFVAVWALFQRFHDIGGWSLPEVALLYGIVNSAWAITDATSRGFDAFGSLVREGEFDRVLLRPRTTVLQLAGYELTLRRIGRFLQGLAVLLWAVSVLDIDWSVAKVALLAAAILGASAFFYALLVIQATICFWTIETTEVMNAFTYGGVETGRMPITIYGPRFRRFFTFVVPLACVSYFPAVAILGRDRPLGYPGWFYWMSPAVGPAFLLVALQIWRFGVRHYRSTGS